MQAMVPKPKQVALLDAISSRQYDTIVLIGAIGTAKTAAMAWAHINIALQFPGSYIPVARKTLAEAKVGTMLNYYEMAEMMTLQRGPKMDFETSGTKMVFNNGSVIQFVPMDYTKDPQWHRIKSINATAAGVDEVDGVRQEGFVTLASRTGRQNRNGAPAITIATCNPNEAWVKDVYYTPYRRGTLPDNVLVLEFELDDSPLFNTGYYERFSDNPPQWQERYLRNNWDFQDDDNSLFKNRMLDNITRTQIPDGDRYAGQDVAREGKDRSVTALIAGNMLTDIKIIAKEDLDRLASDKEKEAPPYTHILGREFISYCERNSVGYQNTAGDAVGIGAGFIDYCRSEDFYVTEFKAGAKPMPKPQSNADKKAKRPLEFGFDMLRSQLAVMLADDMETGNFFIYEGCPHLAEFKREALYHTYTITDKIMKVESKEQIKRRLQRSPDIFDAVIIAYYKMRFGKPASFYDLTPPDENNPEPTAPGRRIDERPITSGLMGKAF